MPVRVDDPAGLVALVGLELKSEIFLITQSEVDRYLALSGDHQWIHSDVERARAELPEGRTIVPGNLLVLQLPRLLQQAYTVTRFGKCYLAEYRRVRFRRPVNTGLGLVLQARVRSVTSTLSFVRLETACKINLVETQNCALTATVVDLFYRTR